MTGLTPDLQRVWRRRDQLPFYEVGANDFSISQVAEILVRYKLAVGGMPPSASKHAAKSAAPFVLWFAFATVDGACEVNGGTEDVERFIDGLRDGGDALDDLAGTVEASVVRYLVRTDGADPEFQQDAGDVLSAGGFVSIFVLDLAAAGEAMALAAGGRPLVTVTYPTAGRPVRRVSRARSL